MLSFLIPAWFPFLDWTQMNIPDSYFHKDEDIIKRYEKGEEEIWKENNLFCFVHVKLRFSFYKV